MRLVTIQVKKLVVNALSFKDPNASYHLMLMGLVLVPHICKQLQDSQAECLKKDHVKGEIIVKRQALFVGR